MSQTLLQKPAETPPGSEYFFRLLHRETPDHFLCQIGLVLGFKEFCFNFLHLSYREKIAMVLERCSQIRLDPVGPQSG